MKNLSRSGMQRLVGNYIRGEQIIYVECTLPTYFTNASFMKGFPRIEYSQNS